MSVPELVELVSPGLWRITNAGYPSNTWVRQHGSGECFLIDPGLDGPLVDRAIEALGLRPSHVFCTHGHFDHIGSASHFQEKHGTPVYLHRADLPTAKGSNFLLMAFKLPYRMKMPKVELVEHDFAIAVDGVLLRYRLTPGHTPGSCVLTYGNTVFSGDTLYASGVGLSSLPGEDLNQLKQSLLALWREIAPSASVCPGHGAAAQMSWIKQNNTSVLRFMGLAEPQTSQR